MSTTFQNDIKNRFKSILTPATADEKHELEVLAAHFEIMSAFEHHLEQLDWTKRELASKVGSSPSYITQLFRGDKIINLDMRVRIERALGLECTCRFQPKIAQTNTQLGKPVTAG